MLFISVRLVVFSIIAIASMKLSADTVLVSENHPLTADTISNNLIHDVPSEKPHIFEYLKLKSLVKYFILLVIALIGIWMFFSIYNYIRNRVEEKRFVTSTRLSIMDKEVQRACKYIEKHYHDPDLSVSSICEALVTGPAFLEALYIRELGMSIDDFITQVRINRVNDILNKDKSISVEELALRTGFTDSKKLAQSFKKVTNIVLQEQLI